MNRLATFCYLACLAIPAVAASPLDEAAERMTAVSIRQDLAAGDPRLAQTRNQLDKVSRLTSETPSAIAYACSRYVGHLHDAAQIEATSLELLDALARFAQAGRPLNDTLRDYVAARKTAEKRDHAGAMAILGRK